MKASESIFILFLFSISLSFIEASAEKTTTCHPIICPVCDYHLNDTFTAIALRALNAGGPSNGTCVTGQLYIHLGIDFGMPNNACCCLPIAQSPPIDCNPRGVNVPDCADNLGIGLSETIEEYYRRVAKRQKHAPSNGCCHAGTFKYIFQAILTGLKHDVCVCMIENQAFSIDSVSSSSSSSHSTSEERPKKKEH